MKIKFLGAAGTVTGSKYLITEGDTNVLVDCGLYQGQKNLRLRNWQDFPVDESKIDAVVLTHAHIDHSGYLPVLIKNGFRGKVYATEPTKALCNVLLPDSGHIQEEDANYANKHGFSKHHPARPLYSAEEGESAIGFFENVKIGCKFKIGELKFCFGLAGHILGAAHVTVQDRHTKVLFSGDIGRYNDHIELAPEPCKPADFVVMESTYGDRNHGDADPIEVVSQLIQDTIQNKGVLLIPAFAVGRTQSMLYCISEAFRKGLAETIPVYLNSPMATRVTHLYEKFRDWHRLDDATCRRVFDLPRYITSVEASQGLNRVKGPAVILSASGMLTGGRILHHVKQLGPHSQNTILLPGFQAPGTRGATLVEGGDRLKIHGDYVPIRARVVHLDLFSAHADQGDLLRWIREMEELPRKIVLVHGEPNSIEVLSSEIHEKFGIEVEVPEYGTEIDTY